MGDQSLIKLAHRIGMPKKPENFFGNPIRKCCIAPWVPKNSGVGSISHCGQKNLLILFRHLAMEQNKLEALFVGTDRHQNEDITLSAFTPRLLGSGR